MSKKTIRNNVARWLAAAASAAALVAGCATKGDGDGSESHFLCTTDSDCASHGDGYRCVEQKCTKAAAPEAGAGGSGGESGASGGGGSRSGGGTTGGSGNAASGGGTKGGSGNATSGGAAGKIVLCPDPFYYPPDAGVGGPPSPSPIGFVDDSIYGCYPQRDLAPTGWFPNEPAPQCPGTSNRCTYAPNALPCGACSPSDVCAMSVAAVCDCGGGPIVDVYWDQWGCKCISGQWDCRLVGVSGASCQLCSQMCLYETRSTPYTTGVVFTGAAGVTVALTSTPAPPSLGDNTWTFALKDEGGAPLEGATITATQRMVDHGHGGVKLIVVTDLGGGSYRAEPVNFNMSGYWETTLHIEKAPIDDRVVINLCVQ